jgi:hypothetical protein
VRRQDSDLPYILGALAVSHGGAPPEPTPSASPSCWGRMAPSSLGYVVLLLMLLSAFLVFMAG